MSAAAIVDTDVFSFWLKGDTRGDRYDADARGKTLCLSFMSVAELKRWSLSRGWGAAKRRLLEEQIARFVVLPYDDPMADAWARITHTRAGAGRPIECADGWIAATAVRHNVPLFTHNAKHYAGIAGLTVISYSDV